MPHPLGPFPAAVEEEPSLDAVVVPWRLGVAYQTIHLSLGQPVSEKKGLTGCLGGWLFRTFVDVACV